MNGGRDAKPGIRFLYLLLLALILWGGEYLGRGLWEPDEARYAYVARETRETGHWAVLQRNGEEYTHKPPLMFWLIRVSSGLTGGHITGVSARLPSLLGVVLALWATAALAGRWFGQRACWPSVLVLCTTYLFWKQGGWAQIDALLCGLEMAALYFLFTLREGRPVLRAAAAYTCMGLAVLAKGPVGFLIPLGAYVAATLAAGRKQELRAWHWAWGPLLTLTFPAVWLLCAWLEGASGSYFRELIFAQNVSRAAGEMGHRQPVWYFLWHFPLEFMPWTLLAPAAWMVLRDRPEWRAQCRGLLAWAAFVVVLFSLSVSKRELYILAAYPAAAMLVGAAVTRLDITRYPRTVYTVAGLLGLLAVALVVAPVAARLPVRPWLGVPAAAVLTIGAACLPALRRHGGYGMLWFYVLAGVLFETQAYVGAVVFPALNPLKTPVELAAAARSKLAPDQRLLIYKVNGELLSYYCGVQGQVAWTEAELTAAMARQGRGLVAMEQRDWDSLSAEVQAQFVPHPFKTGRKKLVWCEFGAGGGAGPG